MSPEEISRLQDEYPYLKPFVDPHKLLSALFRIRKGLKETDALAIGVGGRVADAYITAILGNFGIARGMSSEVNEAIADDHVPIDNAAPLGHLSRVSARTVVDHFGDPDTLAEEHRQYGGDDLNLSALSVTEAIDEMDRRMYVLLGLTSPEPDI